MGGGSFSQGSICKDPYNIVCVHANMQEGDQNHFIYRESLSYFVLFPVKPPHPICFSA